MPQWALELIAKKDSQVGPGALFILGLPLNKTLWDL